MHGENFSLEINNVNLEGVKSVKFLGVILDEHLSWEHHVNGVTSIISKLIPLIYQVRDNLSSSSLRQILYFALIYPSLTHCTAVCGSCNSTVFQGVWLVMKRVVRIMPFSNRFEHSGPLFLRFNLFNYFNIKNICCYYLCTRASAQEAVISLLFLMNVLRDRPIKNCYNYLM